LRTVLLHPAAKEELVEAISFYNSKIEGLGSLLLDEIDSGIEAIQRNPRTWKKYTQHCRRYLFKKFPYAIIYRLKDNTTQIVAFMHQHRKPNYWKSRLN